MALPYHFIVRGALDAELQLQLRVERMTPPTSPLGKATVFGTVLRVFRGDQALLGRQISFGIACLREGEQPPPGGTLWTRLDTLEQAKVIEACLDRAGDQFEVVMWQTEILAEATDKPQLVYDAKEAEPPIYTPEQPSPWPRVLLLLTLAAIGAAAAYYAIFERS